MDRRTQPEAMPAARWPWQRSLQNRIVLTYGAVFLVVLLFLTMRMGQAIYRAQLEEAEHNLELEAFLAANALEDPLSGYAAEFDEYARWEQEREHGSDEYDEDERTDDRTDERTDDRSGGDSTPLDQSRIPVAVPAPARSMPVSSRLHQVAVTYAADTGARVTILDPQGHVVADSAYAIGEVPNQRDQIEVQTALLGTEQHDIRLDPFTYEPTLYAAAPIQQGARILGIVRLALPMRTVMAEIRRLWLNLAITGLLALALATGLGIWIGRRLVRPVRELERAALAIARGDLEQQVAVNSADELGALANAFNHMVNELRRLLEQQRLFVANASHELRTPLTNIKLRTETLLSMGRDDPVIAERYLAEIDGEADRLGRLANVLLDLARLESGERELSTAKPADMRPLLVSMGETMQLRAHSAGIRLVVSVPERLPRLRVWPDQLEAVMVNLLDNAVKYTPAGGEVEVSAQVREQRCRICVRDTGPGIPAEDLPHIFDRFYRVDKARSRRTGTVADIGSGAGLGLSIVKMLAERNGGRVWAESTSVRGSVFVVEFPVAE